MNLFVYKLKPSIALAGALIMSLVGAIAFAIINRCWPRQFVEHYLSPVALKDSDVRSMAFAGSWYPADPIVLQKLFEELRTKAQLRPHKNFGMSQNYAQSKSSLLPTLAIISPHAGYRYSGMAAMRSYLEAKQNCPHNLKRIILIGPLHGAYEVNPNIAILPSVKAFATPFGSLNLDTNAIQQLTQLPHFVVNEKAHDVEHSLEMQLPLLRYMFEDLPIVPVLITHGNNQDSLAAIAAGLKSILRDGDLVITSGDMTHWGELYNYQPFTENVRDNVQRLDEEAYSNIAKLDASGLSKFFDRTKEHMCGFEPIIVLIDLLPANSHAAFFDYYTSQDVMPKPLGEESERCVGYLSVGFSGGHW